MDDGKLIEFVRRHPCLYDKSHPDFKVRDEKRRACLEFASNFEVDETAAIKRWGNVKERFTKEIRGSRNFSGSGASLVRQWALLESLQFLKGHIVPRPMRKITPISQINLECDIEKFFCEPGDDYCLLQAQIHENED